MGGGSPVGSTPAIEYVMWCNGDWPSCFTFVCECDTVGRTPLLKLSDKTAI